MANLYTNQGKFFSQGIEYDTNITTTPITDLPPLFVKTTELFVAPDGTKVLTNIITVTNRSDTAFSFLPNVGQPAFSDEYNQAYDVLGNLIPTSFGDGTLEINGQPASPTSTANGILTIASLPNIPATTGIGNVGTLTISFTVNLLI